MRRKLIHSEGENLRKIRRFRAKESKIACEVQNKGSLGKLKTRGRRKLVQEGEEEEDSPFEKRAIEIMSIQE